MNVLVEIFQGILGFGLDIMMLILRMTLAFIVGGIATVKYRNGLLWGLATLFFPWLIVVIPFMPKNYPRFSNNLTQDPAFKGKNPVIASIMALSAIVAKADGRVSREEITYVKQFVKRYFGVGEQELTSYAEAFEYGKNHPEAYKEFTTILNTFYVRRDMIIAIAYLLMSIAVQTGDISENEEVQIKKILRELGVSEYEYNSIKNSFRADYGQYSYESQQGFDGGRKDFIKKYSEILGVDENATMPEIKKAYRKLVKEYHPDKLASESMPKEYIDFANKKILEVNEAYEYLKKVKEA